MSDMGCFSSGAILYKAVFHGGLKSMWSSVVEVKSNKFLTYIQYHQVTFILQIDEMRRMGRCIQEHDKCVEHAILSSYL